MWINTDVRFEDLSGVGVARAATAVSGETVVVPTASNLIAIDAGDGTEIWRGTRLDHPTAGDGVVVGVVPGANQTPPGSGGPRDAEIGALDAMTGTSLWSAPGFPSYGELWAIGGGALYALVPHETQGVVGA